MRCISNAIPLGRLGTVAWTLYLFGAQPALAYSLGDHEQITLAAFRAVAPCLTDPEGRPKELPDSLQKRVIQANLWEDRNLLNKWLRYSHFYHPSSDEIEEAGIRENSKARILDLEDRMRDAVLGGAPLADRLRLLGFMLHHIQDMSVPLHVLPVNHFWTDGFESLNVRSSASLASESCEALVAEAVRLSPVDIHEQVARSTLQHTLAGYLKATLPSDLMVPLTWFWTEGSEQRFGSYGVLGNAFGMGWLKLGRQSILIRQDEFIRYKRDRLAAAQAASQAIIMKHWLLGALDAAR